ncbi:MAG: hypothetical protein DHS20C20_31590 [Ardenticatenaceae bacterium]|nr:MAG: hypothetical protein DHS20C20_31590 [Ardenticatenaceae bacterium]
MIAFGKRELQPKKDAVGTSRAAQLVLAEAGWNRDLKKPSLQHK